MSAETVRRAAGLAPILAATLLCAAPASSSGQTTAWSGCPGDPGNSCATVTVPLDRERPTRGSVGLDVSRSAPSSPARTTAVLALAGGPGQAALPLRSSFAKILAPALETRDLLVFDQRGTGSSGPLNCTSLRTARTLLEAESGCALELGTARGFYTTADSVADIEAVRIAAGYERLVLFGVSYGTKVAQAYAATFPYRVEALVLDSVVPIEGPDPFRLASLRASTRVISELCAQGACRAASPAPHADLAWVARRLSRGPVSGRVISSRGRKGQGSISEAGLIGLLLAGDLNPTLRAELPGSLRAARRGDWQPLLRLERRAELSPSGSQTISSSSAALFLATTCEESPFPWTRAAGARQRWTEISRAASRIPVSSRRPFSARAALDAGTAPLCVGWPAARSLSPTLGPLPGVPKLVIGGRADLRTPIEDARAITGAERVEVPHVGHSVLSGEPGDCATSAVTAFFTGQQVAACPPGKPRYSPTPRPPRSLSETGSGGITTRAARAAVATVVDARRQVIGTALALGSIPQQVGGLRSGYTRARLSGDRLTLSLSSYGYVPGLKVSGNFNTDNGGTLTLRAVGLRGKLRLDSRGGASGTINGRRVRLAGAASIGSAPEPVPSVAELQGAGRRPF